MRGDEQSSVRPSIRQRRKRLPISRYHIWWRLLTGPVRLLPDFIIIGAQRSGTTSLYNYVTRHPSIARTVTREVHFFDIHFWKGLNWYRAHFPTIILKRYVDYVRKGYLITGETSPYYIFHPVTPQRVAKLLPRVKLIALLRNPVDRAYSHYWHEVRRGNETLSFEDAVGRERERLGEEVERILRDERYDGVHHRQYSYVARGIYVDQIKRWRQFFSKDQMLILSSEAFFADPAATLKHVFEFLNVPDCELTEYFRYNQIDYPTMDAAMRRQLLGSFQPHNERLYEYLGMRFDWDR